MISATDVFERPVPIGKHTPAYSSNLVVSHFAPLVPDPFPPPIAEEVTQYFCFDVVEHAAVLLSHAGVAVVPLGHDSDAPTQL